MKGGRKHQTINIDQSDSKQVPWGKGEKQSKDVETPHEIVGCWTGYIPTRLETRTKESLSSKPLVKYPIDGELCMDKVKPYKRVVEACSGIDVQIVRSICV